MWKYSKELKTWYYEDEKRDKMCISIHHCQNGPKFQVTVAFGPNVCDFKIVKTVEEGKKWAKKNWLTYRQKVSK